MKFLQTVKLKGWALLVVAIPFLIFAPDSRPSGRVLAIGIGIGAVLGIGSGLIFRYFVPLDRLQFFRSLSPRLGRHLIPPPKHRRRNDY